MPRTTIREQRVQPFYDTDFVGHGAVTSGENLASQEKHLFSNANTGDRQRTNLRVAGYLPGDQTFMCKGIRHEISFGKASGTGSGSGLTSVAELGRVVGAVSTFEMMIADKTALEGPCSLTPFSAGPWGATHDSQDPLITNGQPGASLFLLDIGIAIAARQNVSVVERKNDLRGASSNISVVTAINSWTGYKLFRCYLDGFHTREVL